MAKNKAATECKRLPVPVKSWGIDHWSTFAYLETLCVDYDGRIDRCRMRCSSKRHPGYVHMASSTQYPTRLKSGFELYDHDDYDCITDMVRFGLVTWTYTGINPGVVALTDKGMQLAARLRSHKMNGGQFADFDPGSI